VRFGEQGEQRFEVEVLDDGEGRHDVKRVRRNRVEVAGQVGERVSLCP